MKKHFFPKVLMSAFLSFVLVTGTHQSVQAQVISTFQYRHVDPDKRAEFIKRETTYWSKIAENAIDKGNLTFWALLEKVGGADQAQAPNFLFVNVFKNIDDANKVWDASAAFPGVPLSKMETNSISTTTGTFFVSRESWETKIKSVPDKDFNYMRINYYNSSDPSAFIALEKKYWGPFIKSTMDNNQVSQVAWGNYVVLSPWGGDMKFNSLSLDIYPKLSNVLYPNWASDVKFPVAELDSLQKILLTPRAADIYRIVKVVSD
ncbi:MAG: hypothetical protein ABI237_02710 [Ginsengibacter sp.]